ncbi:uncharacterized protein P884DRAFT_261775 [Thermothelomyces heterothallicus CBS 202.75]|uniref:uncharacterized protein n=1 Tax=Thermothelomyces heterothallicus CBS 202.75 TaxID=1149848 RepID=UPI003742FBBB
MCDSPREDTMFSSSTFIAVAYQLVPPSQILGAPPRIRRHHVSWSRARDDSPCRENLERV